MPIRVNKKTCVMFKRTESEKRMHEMGRELSSVTEELERAKEESNALRAEIDAIKEALASKK